MIIAPFTRPTARPAWTPAEWTEVDVDDYWIIYAAELQRGTANPHRSAMVEVETNRSRDAVAG